MRRPPWLLPCLAVFALLAGLPRLAGAQETGGGSASAQIQIELQLERKLLALDLASYREARAVEQRAREQMTQVSGRVDQALAGTSMSLGTLEGLHLELASARAASQIAADRVDWQLQRIQDRLRRIGFLEGESGARLAAGPRDPVSGRWRMTVLPQNQSGTFELTLSGTLVAGSYRMEAGASGSLRGTYTDNRLRLERVDSVRGFDSVFLGSIDPATGRLSGSWTANDLASGQPARGDWSAVREGAANQER